MADSASQAAASKPRRSRYPSQKKSDQKRSKTRVSLGEAYNRWTKIKTFHGIKTHAEMANFLMDRYENTDHGPSTSTPSKRRKGRATPAGSLSSLEKHQPGESGEDTLSASDSLEESYKRSQDTSTPCKSCDRRPSKTAVSSITEYSDRNQDVCVNHPEFGVQRLPDERMVGDRDIKPPGIHVDETVLVIPQLPVVKSERTTQHDRVHSEDDLAGEISNITHNYCQHAPAMPLGLPVEKSTLADQAIGVRYPCATPFQLTVKGTGLVLQWSTSPPISTDPSTQLPKVKEEAEEEFPTSLRVGDKCYPMDLASPSEFVVDEECLLELFKSCRKCNQRCIVQKEVNGLKIVVVQTCGVCLGRFEWTNLPEEDERLDS